MTAPAPAAVRVVQVSRDDGFATNAWPQGKLCVTTTGRVFQGFNRGSAHVSADKAPVVAWSDDVGETWSAPAPIGTLEPHARGTDCWALGVDADDVLWAIVRGRGATNAVGDTAHTLWSSADAGLSWSRRLELPPEQDGFVPELFHDLCLADGRMVSGYHFAGSSRLGFVFFDPSDPVGTLEVVDVVPDGGPAGEHCEPTFAWDASAARIVGGLRSQAPGIPTQFFELRTDGTGFARWPAPDTVPFSPLPVAVRGDVFAAATGERFTTGEVTLWLGTRTAFDARGVSGWTQRELARALAAPVAGSSEAGVPALAFVGDALLVTWSAESAEGSSVVCAARLEPASKDAAPRSV
ncbi:sialidase family protein [Microbacterium jejuense]|uniref:sialidase family protein n=1 Tax=Microbacterium jejuense TaxID=1263637 RepID=UPI0031E5DEE2